MNGPDGKKPPKRHGAITVEEFRDAGFIPEALVNYLALLGWSYDDHDRGDEPRRADRAVLPRAGRQERGHVRLREADPPERRSTSGPCRPTSTLTAWSPTYGSRATTGDEDLVRRVAPLVQEKIATLGEFPGFARFFFERVPPEEPLEDGAVLPVAAEVLARKSSPSQRRAIEASATSAGGTARILNRVRPSSRFDSP